ncbi:DDHD domain-containing protein [Xylariaceae sp. FL0016]|nr:DDHD domain-containing protein [Xylariaceae sp. FL0016]
MPYPEDLVREPPKSHNYGSQCRLAPVINPFTKQTDGIPPVNAQFFYISPIPIDDPLSASPVAATTDSKSARATLRPFAPGDNNALEKAWIGLASDQYRRNHSHARRQRSPSPSLAEANAERLHVIIRDVAIEHAHKHACEGPPRDLMVIGDEPLPIPDTEVALCCPELLIDVGVALRTSFCAVARKSQHSLDRERVARLVMEEMKTIQPEQPSENTAQQRARSATVAASHAGARTDRFPSSLPSSNMQDALLRREARARSHSQAADDRAVSVTIPTKSSLVDDHGISGKPFVRVGTPETTTFSPPSSLPRGSTSSPVAKSAEKKSSTWSITAASSSLPERGRKLARGSVDVPVGVSRLHEVSLPALQMKPIYWSPVNDISTVLRATWFYRDDMRPIDPTVANQLEAGYRELKPHTETWSDELRCAVEVGPLGEEKVSHPLWPSSPRSSKEDGESEEPLISSNPFCAARCFCGESAAEGSLIPFANEDNSSPTSSHRKFGQYHVIYKDETTAFLLKPSLKPSAYYGRRPVAKITKGFTVGVPVVRGFDYDVWKTKHQKTQAKQFPQVASEAEAARAGNRDDICPACKDEKERNQVTDLVLVAHGIGQKLAERVENYHFTHAINAFRRAVNIELGSDAVRSVLREGQNGIMVLPVNWRQNLSFEDGGPMQEEDKDQYSPDGFSLKDIEPKTIPAVRSMISDVMFDIPFYMSHHKPKMVAALVNEANRVYRLWCRNNPGFSENGRVHVIGHSLGSVMCIEVLSRQPTIVPTLQLTTPSQPKFFDFDTKNLFLLGSPSGFFLLLERGVLLPRRGRLKPGADRADAMAEDVVGEAGMFGCLAVDNIYNILAREDPVAYLLNGTLDPTYAASLKTAYVPSVSPGLFQSMGNAMRGMIGGAPSTSSVANPAILKPPTLRLPSQLEMEVHDFTREEIAERKAFLLNDNGQIDYFLRSGGGPLELQYLNMLSAHTSYWANQDLIRGCLSIQDEYKCRLWQQLEAPTLPQHPSGVPMGLQIPPGRSELDPRPKSASDDLDHHFVSTSQHQCR